MHATSAALVAALTTDQLGLVSRAQLIAAGLDPVLARREIAAGRWRRMAGGLYLTGADAPTEEQRRRAALLYVGPDGVLAGPTAAALHGLRDVPTSAAVHVLLPSSRRRAPTAGLVLHRTGNAPPPCSVAGLPVTPVARAVVETARWCGSLRDARAVVTAAVGDRRVTVDQLVVELERSPQQGSAHARRAVRDARVGARSAPEAEVSDLAEGLVRRGLLAPFLLNPELWLDGVLLGAPDLWVPSLGFGHETDSAQFHASSDALASTLDRHERFATAGLPLLHTTPKRARTSPDDLVRRLVGAARERRDLPAGLRVVPLGPLLPEVAPRP